MSFREKSAWISLVVTTGLWGYYFLQILRAPEGWRGPLSLGLLLVVLVATGFLQGGLHAVAAIFALKDAAAPIDERERLISLKAVQMSSFVLAAGVALTAGGVFYGLNTVAMANGILGSLALAETVRAAGVIIGYRRGA